MARGLGVIQRFVIDQLERQPGYRLETWHFIVRRYGQHPTAAQEETVRRAIRTLAARGLVETKRLQDGPYRSTEVRLMTEESTS